MELTSYSRTHPLLALTPPPSFSFSLSFSLLLPPPRFSSSRIGALGFLIMVAFLLNIYLFSSITEGPVSNAVETAALLTLFVTFAVVMIEGIHLTFFQRHSPAASSLAVSAPSLFELV